MPEHHSSLSSRAFGKDADPRLIVAYQSHQDALRFLASALGQPNGIALLQGPAGSGKSTIINEQRDWSSRNTATALVDGTGLTPRQLLDSILAQFRVKVDSPQDDQWLPRLNSFLTQETRRGHTPVLIIDNADRATESALRLLDWLAALQAGSQYALRIVLAGRELTSLPYYGSLHSLVRRSPATYSLNPMSAHETALYLRTRFIAARGERCETLFSIDVCDKLHELSRGWPGELNKLATKIVERNVEKKPEKPKKPKPRIIISRDGEIIEERELPVQKYVIGRSDFADIVIEDTFVSKTHALLQVYSSAIVLLDLNSTNGTTVNSRVVYQTILKSHDVISLGRHRLKIENAPALTPQLKSQIATSDTVTMQNLAGLRRSRALRTIQSIKKG